MLSKEELDAIMKEIEEDRVKEAASKKGKKKASE